MRPVQLNGKYELIVAKLIDLAGSLTAVLHHRGYYNLAQLFSARVAKGTMRIIELSGDSRYQFDLSDPYWNRLLNSNYSYEPELEHLLLYICDIPYHFIDAGANGGYWSILATSQRFGFHSCIAYEPIPSTFHLLSANRKLNNDRFETRQQALYETGGTLLTMRYNAAGPTSAAGASLLKSGASGYESVNVETLSLDDVLEAVDVTVPVLLKLDVEGVEVSVLAASERIRAFDFLVVYEDHGKDLVCEPTAWVLAQNWPVFYIYDNGDVRQVKDITTVLQLKTKSHRGYNFVTTMKGSSFYRRLCDLC